jgi:hypothetical protein
MSGFGAALVFVAEQEWHSRASQEARAERLALEAAKRAERRKQATDLLGGKCQECGSTEKLRFHHYKINGKEHRKLVRLTASDWTVKVGAEEAKKELVLLCEPCHKELHQRMWLKTIEIANN